MKSIVLQNTKPQKITNKEDPLVKHLVFRNSNKNTDHTVNIMGPDYPVWNKNDWVSGNNVFGFNKTYPDTYKHLNLLDYTRKLEEILPDSIKDKYKSVKDQWGRQLGETNTHYRRRLLESREQDVKDIFSYLGNKLKYHGPLMTSLALGGGLFLLQKLLLNPLLRSLGVLNPESSTNGRDIIVSLLLGGLGLMLSRGLYQFGDRTHYRDEGVLEKYRDKYIDDKNYNRLRLEKQSSKTEKLLTDISSVIQNLDISQGLKMSLSSLLLSLSPNQRIELGQILSRVGPGMLVYVLLRYLLSMGKISSGILGLIGGWMGGNLYNHLIG